MLGRRSQQLQGLPAVLGPQDHHLPALQLAGQGEDVAHVVVDDQDLLAGELRVGLLDLVEHLPGRRAGGWPRPGAGTAPSCRAGAPATGRP